MTDYTTPSSSLADSVPAGGSKMEESLVANVALPHPLPRREALQQSSSLSTVSPASVDLTLKVHTHTHNTPFYAYCVYLLLIRYLISLVRWSQPVKRGRTPPAW